MLYNYCHKPSEGVVPFFFYKLKNYMTKIKLIILGIFIIIISIMGGLSVYLIKNNQEKALVQNKINRDVNEPINKNETENNNQIISTTSTQPSITCNSQTAESPEKTLQCLCSAIRKQNISEALKYCSQYSQERLKRVFGELDEKNLNILADAICINSKKTYEDETVIEFKGFLITSDGEKFEDSFRLVLEDNKWRLTGL